MKRFILALMALLLLLGVGGVTPAQAAPAATSPVFTYGIKADGTVEPVSAAAKADAKKTPCVTQPDGKCYHYTGYMFAQRNICFQNNLGVFWNYEQAQAGFESGTATVKFYNHGPSTDTPTSCAASPGWNNWQILTYSAYTVNDNYCSQFSFTVDGSGYYNANTTVRMNASASRPVSCTSSTQHKNNQVSQAIGTILGLETFSSSTQFTASIMNSYFDNSYNFPGTDDRNALYWKYLLQ